MLIPKSHKSWFRQAPLLAAIVAIPAHGQDWPNVGNDRGGMRYSPLTQINRSNVASLEVAWTYHCGDMKNGYALECTPIVVGGLLYATTIGVKVVALDAATGREMWKFDPYADPVAQPKASGGVNRGLAYWSDGKQARILLGAPDGRLISLDAKSGKLDPGFGKNGSVDLREGMDADLDRLNYGPTSAPAICGDTVILGMSCPEGGKPAPGDVRAFDVRSGKELWRFHTIPRPGEFGNETWEGDSWKRAGAANNWSGATVDHKRGIVFVATGSASPDFWGGDRKGDNLFANCVIALDARTGKRLWHFQTIHHDLVDHDLPTTPNLVTVTHNGKKIDAVAQVSKMAYVYLFDRVTGKPLFPIEERPAPTSDIPGEWTAATQPAPLKPPPFAPQFVTESDLTDISPEAHDEALARFRTYRSGQPFLPPSLQGTVVAPGLLGGATWSGASFDPTTGILYVNSNIQPNIVTLKPAPKGSPEPFVVTGYNKFLDKDGYPAIKPPWGTVCAIDLNKGEIRWQSVLGEYPELTARGIPRTGTQNFGGTIVTAGGVVFIGGSKDEKMHAFDKATGALLWEAKLPAGGYATPCTYMAGGRQYVVIACGGGGKPGTRMGDAYVAFALPEGSTQPAKQRQFDR